MIGEMAIAITLPGFNDLGRSVTPTFLLIEKNEENVSIRSLHF